jgi:uncharacterized membrane protein
MLTTKERVLYSLNVALLVIFGFCFMFLEPMHTSLIKVMLVIIVISVWSFLLFYLSANWSFQKGIEQNKSDKKLKRNKLILVMLPLIVFISHIKNFNVYTLENIFIWFCLVLLIIVLVKYDRHLERKYDGNW